MGVWDGLDQGLTKHHAMRVCRASEGREGQKMILTINVGSGPLSDPA